MNLTNPQKILYFMVYAMKDGRLTYADRDVLVQRHFFKDKKAISNAIYLLSKDGLVEKCYGYWAATRRGFWYIKNVCDEKGINAGEVMLDKVMLDKTFATNDNDYNDYDEDYGFDDEDEDSALNDDIEEDPDDSDFFAMAEDDVDDEPNATTSYTNDYYKHRADAHMADAFKYMADAFRYMKDAFSRL